MSDHSQHQPESKMAWGTVLVVMTIAALALYFVVAFLLHKIEAHHQANSAQVTQPVPAEPAAVAAAPEAAEPAAPADGKEVYGRICVSCHLAEGTGNAVFPPLAGSEYVTGDAARFAKIVLHGLSGPITVGGKKYDSAMPAWGAALSDDEIAAVMTYTRAAWGNAAPAVDAAFVAGVRKATASQTKPYTAKELK